MAVVVRSDDEVMAAHDRAQKETFAAEDEGLDSGDAGGQYALLRWLLGYQDTDPTAEFELGQA